MNTKILRLVRIKNLLIVVFTMLFMRYLIIEPILRMNGFHLQLNLFLFTMLVLATVFITAGGYVINDYFDTRTDIINRPNTVVVGKSISRSHAIGLHMVLSAIGIVLGTFVSFKIGKPIFSLLFILTSGMLWFYSTTYKRQLLVGNIVVATLTALVPLMPLLFELPLLGRYWIVITRYQLNVASIVYWVGGYAVFAFLFTLTREIIKDIEDFEGDASFGRNTIPVHFGIKPAKVIVASLVAITIGILIFVYAAYMRSNFEGNFDYISLIYLIIFILIPCFGLLFAVLLAENKKQFHKASQFSKLIMLFGLFYAVIFRLLIVG
ncbi:MAG: geranylgeranylglycerol-phosphate geranylgeranyltransferase [Bacteroidales bacterium]|nr:geranylgeranylglycerol-phosphate geranylgeranyltransferase [Bacteroidales bacterium]HPD94590.1 geranylgeranylglycerol-phosphate geranylgeranyltransferase [Tenuifilaceae bacterium]HRX31890.1 geranylgeranylglycerol-phosphate geranylgeranyltransferase [Tenuifilaceae bacterium]